MALKSSTVCLLVFVLVQATQHVPCISARSAPQLPLTALTNPLGLPPASIPGICRPPLNSSSRPSRAPTRPTLNHITSAISNSVGGLPASLTPSVPKIPTVNDVTSAISTSRGAPPLNFSTPPSGSPKLPNLNDVTSAISNAIGAPTVSFPAVNPVNLPNVSGVTNAVRATSVNLSGTTDRTRGIANAVGALPLNLSRVPGVTDLTNGIVGSTPVFPGVSGTSPPLGNPLGSGPGFSNPVTNIPGINSPPVNFPGLNSPSPNIPGLGNPLANVPGFSSPLTSFPGATPSTTSVPQVEEPGTSITVTVSISSKGLGSTTLTTTSRIPPLNEIQLPDFWSFFSNPLSHEPSSPTTSTGSPP